MKKHLAYILILLHIMWSVDIFAAVHYCTPTGGAVTKDGVTWATAFEGIPATLTRGDTYYISEGTYPALTLDDAVDEDKYIYIKKCGTSDAVCTAADGYLNTDHDGQAIFTRGDTGAVINITKSYYEIDGVTGGGPTSWTSGHGIKVTSTKLTTTLNTLVNITHSGTGTDVASHIRLLHTELAHVGAEYNPQGTNCYGPLAIQSATTGGNSSAGGHYFAYNYIHDSPVMLMWGHRPGSFTLEYNYFERSASYEVSEPASEVQGSGITTYGGQDQIYRNNIFKNIDGSCGVCLYTWHGDLPVDNITFYNNVWFYDQAFRDAGSRDMEDGGREVFGVQNGWIANDGGSGHTKNVKVYNNTFSNLNGYKLAAIYGFTTAWAAEHTYASAPYLTPTVANGYYYRGTTGTTGASEPSWPTTPGDTVVDGTVTFTNMGTHDYTGNEFKNNIVYNVLGIPRSADLATFTLSNNWFYANKDYRNFNSLDSGWVSTGESNVLGTTQPFVNEFSDFNLAAGATAINAGADLGASYNTDILGISRPQGAAFDIGAYEYTGGATTYTITFTTATGCTASKSGTATEAEIEQTVSVTDSYGYDCTASGCGGTFAAGVLTYTPSGDCTVTTSAESRFATLGGSGTVTLGGSGTITLGN